MSDTYGRLVWAGVTAAALVFIVFANVVAWRHAPQQWWDWFPARAAATVYAMLGAHGWRTGRSHAVGPLLMACGTTVFVGDLYVLPHPALAAPAFCFAYLFMAFALHALVALPYGSLPDRPSRLLVVTGYLTAVGSQAAWYVVDQPPPAPVYLIGDAPWITVEYVAAFAIGVAVLGLLAQRWRHGTNPMRRSLTTYWAAVTPLPLLAITVAAAGMTGVSDPHSGLATRALAYGWVLASAAALWWRHVWLRQAGQRLATIALELDRHLGAGGYRPHLQRALATALGDPGLRVARRVADGTFVDTHGRAVTPLPERDGQVATPVRSGGRTIAVVLHDASLWRDPELPTAALATVRAATDRLHLSDAVRTQARSALAERHRIQRDLHDGAQHQFLAASLLLDIAGQRLAQSPHSAALVAAVGEAQRHLAAALRSLRELTAGVYPQTLIEHGLVVALRELCRCSPIPATLDAEPSRWPEAVEVAAYFVVTEALANVYRHAHARRVAVTVHARSGRLRLTVTDDGCGGVAHDDLRGIRDRLAGVGGTLRLDDVPEHGTTVTAELPIEGR